MNRAYLIFLIYSALFLFSACSPTNQLHYKCRRHFYEENVIRIKPPFTLSQDICYNRPRVHDEEYCHTLTFTFLDTTAAKAKRVLNLETDTAIVNTDYGVYSTWLWGEEPFLVSGRIEILAWNRRRIRLKEQVVVVNAKGDERLMVCGFLGGRNRRWSRREKTANFNSLRFLNIT